MPSKTPQDHKTKDDLQDDARKQQSFADVEGSELLRPFTKVKGSDQARLTGRLMKLGLIKEGSDSDDDGEDEIDIDDLDFDAVADLIDYVSEKFALDAEEFDAFTMGSGGMKRAMSLAVAYAGEMGKDDA